MKKLKPPRTDVRLRCGHYRVFFDHAGDNAIEITGVRNRREAYRSETGGPLGRRAQTCTSGLDLCTPEMLQRKRDRLENSADCATLLYVPLPDLDDASARRSRKEVVKICNSSETGTGSNDELKHRGNNRENLLKGDLIELPKVAFLRLFG